MEVDEKKKKKKGSSSCRLLPQKSREEESPFLVCCFRGVSVWFFFVCWSSAGRRIGSLCEFCVFCTS
ncbi:hypothetical protein LINPERHAP2_LOCUS39583, partial [Linum perenne]